MDEVQRLRFERNTTKAEVVRLTAETEKQRGELGQLRKDLENEQKWCNHYYTAWMKERDGTYAALRDSRDRLYAAAIDRPPLTDDEKATAFRKAKEDDG